MYREALVQLALPGFLLGGMLLAGTLLTSGNALSWYLATAGTPDTYWYFAPDISEAWALIPIYIWVAPFLFSILSFNFLTSRKKSDYYHALPLRREALFFSYLAAIVTWLFATASVAMLLGGGVFVAGGIGVDWASIGIMGLEFMTAMLFAVSLAMLAVALSGTLFSNIVLINIFLWLPLLASTLFRRGVISMVPTLPQNAVSFFGLDASITLFAAMRLIDFPEATTSLVDALWTLTIALIILAVAAFFFVRRKSEMAGNSAASDRMQALYRIAVGLPPLLLIFSTASLFSFLMLFSLSGITLLVASLMLMCTFELISTKRWQNLLKVPLSLGIALAISLVFSFSIWAVATYEASFTPSAEEIESVRIVGIPNEDRHFGHIDFLADLADAGVGSGARQKLLEFKEGEVLINDEAVKTTVAYQLDSNLSPVPIVPHLSFSLIDVLFFDDFMFSYDAQFIFEIRTTSGATRQRVLNYGSYSWSDSRVRINELGEALIDAASD